VQTNPLRTTNLADTYAGGSYIHFHMTFTKITSISSLSKGIPFSAECFLYFYFQKWKWTIQYSTMSTILQRTRFLLCQVIFSVMP